LIYPTEAVFVSLRWGETNILSTWVVFVNDKCLRTDLWDSLYSLLSVHIDVQVTPVCVMLTLLVNNQLTIQHRTLRVTGVELDRRDWDT